MAARLGLKVIARGTQHCMGAHSVCLSPLPHSPTSHQTLTPVHKVAAGGIIVDMRYMNSVTYNPDDQSATCSAGATWKDVIFATNAFGRSPRTLQSYASRVTRPPSSTRHQQHHPSRCPPHPADTAPSASGAPWAPTLTASPPTTLWLSPSCRSISSRAAVTS